MRARVPHFQLQSLYATDFAVWKPEYLAGFSLHVFQNKGSLLRGPEIQARYAGCDMQAQHWCVQWLRLSRRARISEARASAVRAPTAPSSMGPGIVVFAHPASGCTAGTWACAPLLVMVTVARPEVERTHSSSATTTTSCRVTSGYLRSDHDRVPCLAIAPMCCS